MVDPAAHGGKDSDATSGSLLVVAGALIAPDGRWLLHRRPPGKMYEGLWEFPGGKVEPSETYAESLARELQEELGVAIPPGACRPALFAEDGAREGRGPIVLLLYTVCAWEGVPQALEGGAIGWFAPREALSLRKPPLDEDLAKRLFRLVAQGDSEGGS